MQNYYFSITPTARAANLAMKERGMMKRETAEAVTAIAISTCWIRVTMDSGASAQVYLRPEERLSLHEDIGKYVNLKRLTIENDFSDLHRLATITGLEEIKVDSRRTHRTNPSFLPTLLKNNPGLKELQINTLETLSGPQPWMESVKKLQLDNLSQEAQTLLGYMPNLEKLEVTHADLSDLTAFERCPALTSLSIYDSPVEDLSAVASLPSLQHLCIKKGTVQNLEPLAKLPLLKKLCIAKCLVSDLRPLAGLSLRALCLDGNLIQDLSPLATLSDLAYLELRDNPLADLSPLEKLPLEVLHLENVKIHSYQSLRSITTIKELAASSNPRTEELAEFLRDANPNICVVLKGA